MNSDRILIHRQRMARAKQTLRRFRVPFKEKKLDVLLDVHNSFDFWPMTSAWVHRATGVTGKGLSSLLSKLGVKQ